MITDKTPYAVLPKKCTICPYISTNSQDALVHIIDHLVKSKPHDIKKKASFLLYASGKKVEGIRYKFLHLEKCKLTVVLVTSIIVINNSRKLLLRGFNITNNLPITHFLKADLVKIDGDINCNVLYIGDQTVDIIAQLKPESFCIMTLLEL